jgi:type II secretory pathway pseudopilin PulG
MVEMMFAILILSVVLLGLVSVLGSILDNQYNSRAYDKVSIAANTVFGQARQALAEHFDRPLVPDVFPAGRQTLPNLDGVSYEITQTPKRPDLMQVDLVIHWTDKRGQEHHKSMSTKFLRVK